jgi:tetratricopeptide (TPR) repeat protein
MALKRFFTTQLELLRLFMSESGQTVRCVQIATDMKPLLMKALAGLDTDDSPHLMLCLETPFENQRQYFDGLVNELHGEVSWWEAPLMAAGFAFKLRSENLDKRSPRERFVTYAAALADSLQETFGCVVLILVPDQVADGPAFRAAVHYLARNTPSPWLKYIVVDDRQAPALDRIEEENPDVWVQVFHIAPEEIESQAKTDLESGTALDPSERRQYIALLAGFAYAHRQYDEAQRLQQQWLDLIGPDGAPSETANACYNLANTHLARKDYAAAEVGYGRALELALDHDLGPLVPMVLTNLGVTLYHQRRWDQALQSFQVARDTCRARDLRPAEAHVLDCQARTYEADGQLDEAERCWNEALGVYDSMSAETFAEAREGGRADILDKLERLAASRKKAAEEVKQAVAGAKAATEEVKPAPKAGWFGRRKEA